MLKTIYKITFLFTLLTTFDWFVIPFLTKISYSLIKNTPYCYEKADILAIGDSHLERAIYPDHNSSLKIMNYAKPGNYQAVVYATYNDYIKNIGSPPKVLLLSAQAWMFKENSKIENYFHLSDKSYGKEYIAKLFSLKASWERFRNLLTTNFVGANKYLESSLLKLFNNEQSLCVHPHQYSFEKNNRMAKSIVKDKKPKSYHTLNYVNDGYHINEHLNIQNIIYFKKLLNLLEKDNVLTIFVEAPEFIGSSETFLGKDIFYSELEELISNRKKVIIWRNSEFSINPENKNHFYDGGWGITHSHLTPQSARLFTAELVEKITKLGIE
jgi:hypothetical protein